MADGLTVPFALAAGLTGAGAAPRLVVVPGAGEMAAGSSARGGTRTDTRILYFARGHLRIVGGDGRGDRSLALEIAALVAWRPDVLEFAEVSRLGGVSTMGTGRLDIRAAWGYAPNAHAIAW